MERLLKVSLHFKIQDIASCVRSWRRKARWRHLCIDGKHCSNNQSSQSRIQASDMDVNPKLKPCYCIVLSRIVWLRRAREDGRVSTETTASRRRGGTGRRTGTRRGKTRQWGGRPCSGRHTPPRPPRSTASAFHSFFFFYCVFSSPHLPSFSSSRPSLHFKSHRHPYGTLKMGWSHCALRHPRHQTQFSRHPSRCI